MYLEADKEVVMRSDALKPFFALFFSTPVIVIPLFTQYPITIVAIGWDVSI